MSDFLYTNLTNMNHLNNWLKIMLGKEINYRDCNESKFTLFKEGPSIMHIKSLEKRLQSIESRQINQ